MARGTRELTNSHSLSFYGKLADVAQALKKGDNVYVDGRIEQLQFIAREGSKPETVHEIVVSQYYVIAPVRRGNKAGESVAGKNVANASLSAAAGVENDSPVAGPLDSRDFPVARGLGDQPARAGVRRRDTRSGPRGGVGWVAL